MSTALEHIAWPPPAVYRHPPQHSQPHVQPHRRPIVAAPLPPPAATSATAIALLLPLRIFLAAGWLRAGVEKSIDHTWWNGAKLRGFLTSHHDLSLSFFRPVMDNVFAPYAVGVTVVVVVAEILTGLAIATGRSMRLALWSGMLLNVTLVLCGQVNPSAFYLVMEIALLFAIADGILGARPSPANGRTLAYGALAAVVGCALTPFVRTIDPAKVIADPAMMLVFLSLTSAATILVRWIMANVQRSAPTRSWTGRCSDWAHARRRIVD